jgi:membrane protein implicated in regulation of membrane protease activity
MKNRNRTSVFFFVGIMPFVVALMVAPPLLLYFYPGWPPELLGLVGLFEAFLLAILVHGVRKSRKHGKEYIEISETIRVLTEHREATAGEISLVAADASGGELSVIAGEEGALTEAKGDDFGA